jgi:hypothetical protein
METSEGKLFRNIAVGLTCKEMLAIVARQYYLDLLEIYIESSDYLLIS